MMAFALAAAAQQPMEETDSVWVEGRITEASSGQAMGDCEVQLLLAGEITAIAVSDSEGYYSLGWIASGMYTLSVLSEGRALYYTECPLVQNTQLNIALMPDNSEMRSLAPARITASRLQPVYHPIKSPDDPRLWNLSGQMTLSGPASMDLSGGPFPRFGGYSSVSLAEWRPAWIDAPFPKTNKAAKKEPPEKQKKEEEK